MITSSKNRVKRDLFISPEAILNSSCLIFPKPTISATFTLYGGSVNTICANLPSMSLLTAYISVLSAQSSRCSLSSYKSPGFVTGSATGPSSNSSSRISLVSSGLAVTISVEGSSADISGSSQIMSL